MWSLRRVGNHRLLTSIYTKSVDTCHIRVSLSFNYGKSGHWIITTERVGNELSDEPPVYDINALDLYTSMMAFSNLSCSRWVSWYQCKVWCRSFRTAIFNWITLLATSKFSFLRPYCTCEAGKRAGTGDGYLWYIHSHSCPCDCSWSDDLALCFLCAQFCGSFSMGAFLVKTFWFPGWN